MGVKRIVIFLLIVLFFIFCGSKIMLKKNNTNILETKLIYHQLSKKYIRKSNINLVHVKTNVLDVIINLNGGDIQEAKLLNYQSKLNSLKKLKILHVTKNIKSQIKSGINENDDIDNIMDNQTLLYTIHNKYFSLINGKKIIAVSMEAISKNNIHYIKTFIFKKDSYEIDIQYKIHNLSTHNIYYSVFGKFKQHIYNLSVNTLFKNKVDHRQKFHDIAYSSDCARYKKYFFNDVIGNHNLYFTSYHGWIAMLQKYFSVAWILNINGENTIYTYQNNNNEIIFGYKSPILNILPKEKKVVKEVLWVGPKIQSQMLSVAPYFDLTINYGLFWFLTQPLFKILNIIYSIVGNWGISIILTICLVRIIIYPITKIQHITTIKTKMLQPEIYVIKKKFKNNVKKSHNEILKLYKKNNINPLSSVFTVLIQMPVFLSLYYMISNSVELRHQPFIFWIHDLSSQDPYYILPICMGITAILIQKTLPSNNLEVSLQDKLANIIPVVCTLFFLYFPAGIVLYYTFNNIVTIIQQIIIFNNLKLENKKI